MNKEKADTTVRTGVGIPTVILILMALGLTIFASLAVRAAYSELKLTRESAEAVRAYYAADARIEEQLFDLMGAAREGRSFTYEDGLVLSEEINDFSYIEAVLSNESGDGRELLVLSHKIVTEGLDGYEDIGFEITDGGFFIQ